MQPDPVDHFVLILKNQVLLNVDIYELDKIKDSLASSSSSNTSPETFYKIVDYLPNFLQIPSIFVLKIVYESEETESEEYVNKVGKQHIWNSAAHVVLCIVELIISRSQPLEVDLNGLIVPLARFINQGDAWSSKEASRIAISCIDKILSNESKRDKVARSILSSTLPPFFSKSIHPNVNPNTGRYMQSPFGGNLATDTNLSFNEYDSSISPWKGQQGLGISGILSCAIKLLPENEVESNWQYIIPPLITLLDDSDPKCRLDGLSPLNALLDRVSFEVLYPLFRRTGVGELFSQALYTSLTYLQPNTHQELVYQSFLCLLKLIDVVNPSIELVTQSRKLGNDEIEKLELDRFEALSRVTDQGLIYMWTYAGEKVNIATIAAKVTLPLCNRLGISTVRYLKVIVPQLAGHLRFPEPCSQTFDLQLYAAKSLDGVINLCDSNRISPHCMNIVTSVMQCWTNLYKPTSPTDITKQQVQCLSDQLKSIIVSLDLDQTTRNKFESIDPNFFNTLFS